MYVEAKIDLIWPVGAPSYWIFFFFGLNGHVPLVVEAFFCFLAQRHSPFILFIP